MNAQATGGTFSVSMAVVLMIAIIGGIVWAICTNATAKTSGAEIGRSMLYAGLIAFCILISGNVFRC